MKSNDIGKLAILGSLALGGCTNAKELERLVINRIISNPSTTSDSSNYASLNPPNDLFKEQGETSNELINYIVPTFNYDAPSIDSPYWDINEWQPEYLDEIRNGSDNKNENEKNIFNIPKILLDFQEEAGTKVNTRDLQLIFGNETFNLGTKGLQFAFGNEIFTLGKTIKFEYKDPNNYFIRTCEVELSGILDGDYSFWCGLRFWW